MSSPRAWGCFCSCRHHFSRTAVFPTSVGVFLGDLKHSGEIERLPHERGGVSGTRYSSRPGTASSPRAWGCFPVCVVHGLHLRVFPTSVGVFPGGDQHLHDALSLPHERGGVSGFLISSRSASRSSPRAWGCFRLPDFFSQRVKVFPTSVGVFPGSWRSIFRLKRLPHERGGVSSSSMPQNSPLKSSPRAWGCFPPTRPRAAPDEVFPTSVGVFPEKTTCATTRSGLPHERGGVSWHHHHHHRR